MSSAPGDFKTATKEVGGRDATQGQSQSQGQSEGGLAAAGGPGATRAVEEAGGGRNTVGARGGGATSPGVSFRPSSRLLVGCDRGGTTLVLESSWHAR